MRVTKRKQVQAEAVSAARDVDSPPSEADGIYDPKNDIDLLKSLIVGDENLEVFRQKLNATREYRAQMMTKKETEIKEHFPYFFTHPMKLVCKFFQIFEHVLFLLRHLFSLLLIDSIGI